MGSDPSISSTAIIPLAVLCVFLLIGAIGAIIATRKIARARLLRELQLAAEAKAAEARLGEKPELVELYVQPPPPYHETALAGELPWTNVLVRNDTRDCLAPRSDGFLLILQPISSTLQSSLSSPHPHHTIEKRPGYARSPFIDGNVLQLSVGIVMPNQAKAEGQPLDLQTVEYCIGTSDVVVCSLLNARQRLVGLN